MGFLDSFKSLFEPSRPLTSSSETLPPLKYPSRSLDYPADVYTIPTLVITYFPVSRGRIDRRVTGDVDALWAAGAVTREHARRMWDIFQHAVEALVEIGPDLIDTFIPGKALVRRAAAYSAGGIDGQAAWRTESGTWPRA